MSIVPAGSTDVIAARILVDGASTAGAAIVTAKIQRASDGLWLNTANDTWGAFNGATAHYALAVDAADDALYTHMWTTPASPDVYTVTIEVTAPFVGSAIGEIDTRTISATRTGLALAAAVTTLQAGVTTLLAGVTVAALAADTITGTSIASSAVTKIQAGLAAASALASATVDVVTSRKRLTNRRSLAANGVETIYDDDGVTPLKTRTYTDYQGNAISLAAGEPARASVES